jgi:arginyl-tRNA synthetase
MLHSNPKTSSEYPPYIEVVAEALVTAIDGRNGSRITEDVKRSLEPSNRPELGELAFKTFVVSKKLGRNPQDIASSILHYAEAHPDLFHSIKVVLPYVNFSLNYGKFTGALYDLHEYVAHNVATQDDTVVVEHTQPNTHKELHVGHLRNTILGDAIFRILRPFYRRVFSVDYHGDEGIHVARTIWYIKKHQVWPDLNSDRGAWLGDMYALAVAEIEAANDTELAAQYFIEVSAILQNIEARRGEDYGLWKETRAWSLSSFNKVYNWLGVHFDRQYSESTVSEASQRRVDEYLAKGVFVRSEGAIGCDLSEFNLGFCMLRKSDGSGLYATKDVELAIERYNGFHFDTCIYVVDVRQRFHFQQVFHTLKKMGFPFADYCIHLGYDVVQTREGTISSRRGARFSAQTVTKELEEVALANIVSRWGDDALGTTEATVAAHAVALAAMRYGMLRVDPEKKIMFDREEWLSPEGNTGPYLLYTYARIASLLSRAGYAGERRTTSSIANSEVISQLEDARETALLSRVLQYPYILREAAIKLKPNVICNHVYETAQLFNSYYNQVPILPSENPTLRLGRLCLCTIVGQYFSIAFKHLGIQPVSRI